MTKRRAIGLLGIVTLGLGPSVALWFLIGALPALAAGVWPALVGFAVVRAPALTRRYWTGSPAASLAPSMIVHEYVWANRARTAPSLRVVSDSRLLAAVAGPAHRSAVVISDTYLHRLDRAERIALWIRLERSREHEALSLQRIGALRDPLAVLLGSSAIGAGMRRVIALVLRPWGACVAMAFPADAILSANDRAHVGTNRSRASALASAYRRAMADESGKVSPVGAALVGPHSGMGPRAMRLEVAAGNRIHQRGPALSSLNAEALSAAEGVVFEGDHEALEDDYAHLLDQISDAPSIEDIARTVEEHQRELDQDGIVDAVFVDAELPTCNPDAETRRRTLWPRAGKDAPAEAPARAPAPPAERDVITIAIGEPLGRARTPGPAPPARRLGSPLPPPPPIMAFEPPSSIRAAPSTPIGDPRASAHPAAQEPARAPARPRPAAWSEPAPLISPQAPDEPVPAPPDEADTEIISLGMRPGVGEDEPGAAQPEADEALRGGFMRTLAALDELMLLDDDEPVGIASADAEEDEIARGSASRARPEHEPALAEDRPPGVRGGEGPAADDPGALIDRRDGGDDIGVLTAGEGAHPA